MHRSFLAKSWFVSSFLIKSQFKNVWKNDFSSCWQDLGFAGCFFFLNFNSKSIEKLMFLAFGKILVLLLLVFLVQFLL